MSVKEKLTEALIDGYERTGEEVGFWGYRFLRAVRNNGGLATAKRMLTPRSPGQRTGLDRLLEAGRPDLTMEAIIMQPQFRSLFTASELEVASERLGKYGKDAARRIARRERLYPDDLELGVKYFEGARKQVRVNAYERDPRARDACLKHFGYRCVVCDLLFEERYGSLGKNFIHVHHLKPFALTNGAYQLNPIKDLRPVCPNCHAMIRHPEKILTIKKLKVAIARLRIPSKRRRPTRN